MHRAPSQSALTLAAAALRGIWVAVVAGFGALVCEADRDALIHNWVCGIFRTLDDMLARYRAGMLPPVVAPSVETFGRAAVANGSRADSAQRPQAATGLLESLPQTPRILRRLVARALPTVQSLSAQRVRMLHMMGGAFAALWRNDALISRRCACGLSENFQKTVEKLLLRLVLIVPVSY